MERLLKPRVSKESGVLRIRSYMEGTQRKAIRPLIFIFLLFLFSSLLMACASSQQITKETSEDSNAKIKTLVDRGGNINERDPKTGKTPLHVAVDNKQTELVKSLIEKGADVNATDNEKYTPLTLAVQSNNKDVVNILIERDADVDARDSSGYTPLLWATYSGNVEIVKILIDGGADVDIDDSYGTTPLIIAVSSGHFEIAKLLIEEDADVLAMDSRSYKASDHLNVSQKLARRLFRPEDYELRASLLKQLKDKEASQLSEGTYLSKPAKRYYDTKINYHDIIPKINYRGDKTISVIVNDKRPYVLSRQTGPEYVGITRGGFGRPYDICTSTLKPLAEEFSQFIVNGLVAVGFKIMESSTADRIVSIDILEWLSITGGGLISFTFGTDLHYNLFVNVFDGKNKILAQQEVKGTDSLGGSLSQINELIPRATENIFNKILSSSEIRTALTETKSITSK